VVAKGASVNAAAAISGDRNFPKSQIWNFDFEMMGTALFLDFRGGRGLR
jgi:hypothetical protein